MYKKVQELLDDWDEYKNTKETKMISKKSRRIKSLAKKIGHIPKGVTMEELRKLKRESYSAYNKASKKLATLEDFKIKKSKKKVK